MAHGGKRFRSFSRVGKGSLNGFFLGMYSRVFG